MAAFWTSVGANRVADILFDDTAVDATLYLGVFTNSSGLTTASTAAVVTEPSGGAGGGYARIALTRGTWDVTLTVASYAEQTFTADGENWGNCYGYFIDTASSGTGGTLMCHEVFSDGPYDINDGDSIKITPTITIS